MLAAASAIESMPGEQVQLAFAVGANRCIGSHLARIELRVAFEERHRRLPNCRLDPDRPPVRHLSMVTGFRTLPVRFD